MVAIVDYGEGNLFSLSSSFAAINAETVVTGDAEVIRKADKIILPGVGAFGDAYKMLEKTNLIPFLKTTQKPVLGICLGMQMAVIEFARNVLGYKDWNDYLKKKLFI